jgi:hypothetical protein
MDCKDLGSATCFGYSSLEVFFYVGMTVHQESCVQQPTRCTVYSSFIELKYLHMFRASTAQHQEVRSMYMASARFRDMAPCSQMSLH